MATFWPLTAVGRARSVRARHPALAVALAAVACLSACSSSDGRAKPSHRFFAPNSVWNRPLPRNAPLAADSRQLVSELQRQVRQVGPWINTTTYSVPIVTVSRRQRAVRVKLDTSYPSLAKDFSRVPVPPGARPANGGDRHLVVWQPSSNTMWEFWLMSRRPDGWHARWGAKISHVTRNRGIIPAPEGATASGLPLVGGLMTVSDLRRGRIDHALALAVPGVRKGVVTWPADRTDGRVSGPRSIPIGTRFRLDPRVDVDKLGLTFLARAIARAAQRYGIIVRDTSGSVSLYAQAPPASSPHVYSPVFHGAYPNQLLAHFPWNRLQVVRAPARRVRSG
jgi:hypothetical protein